VLFHGKFGVEFAQHLVGLPQDLLRERPGSEHVVYRDGLQRRGDPVPGDVDEVYDEVVVVDPSVVEAVAAQLARRQTWFSASGRCSRKTRTVPDAEWRGVCVAFAR
jgi:hypothetical protein